MKSVEKRLSAEDRKRKQLLAERDRLRVTVANLRAKLNRYDLKLTGLENKVRDL